MPAIQSTYATGGKGEIDAQGLSDDTAHRSKSGLNAIVMDVPELEYLESCVLERGGPGAGFLIISLVLRSTEPAEGARRRIAGSAYVRCMSYLNSFCDWTISMRRSNGVI